jgi:hypothetical protein
MYTVAGVYNYPRDGVKLVYTPVYIHHRKGK